MSDNKKIIYYNSYTQDMVESSNQDYKLKKDYKWINNNPIHKAGAALIYGLALIVGKVGCKISWGIEYVNKSALKQNKDKGYFIYANHTQPVGDVVMPALACSSKRVYVIVSQANYGLTIIGKLLSMLGALPVPDTISQYKKFTAAYKLRIKQKHPVIIYPEAHVWPYCTFIRPFEKTSFRFPAELKAPVYAMTTTYKKRYIFNKCLKRPKIVTYIDGPFYPENDKSVKENQQILHDKVYEIMQKRSLENECEYIHYQKLENKKQDRN